MRTLYEPVRNSPFDPEKLYLGTKGGHVPTFSSGVILEKWNNLTKFDNFINEITDFCRILPHHINYTVAVRNAPSSKTKYVDGITSLWVDVDNTIWDSCWSSWKESVLPKLNKILPPSVIVNSGWGIHLYWMLDDYIKIDSGHTSVSAIFYLNKFLAWLIKGDYQGAGAEHLLRIPGSFNCKADPFVATEIFTDKTIQKYNFESLYNIALNITEKSMEAHKKLYSDSKSLLSEEDKLHMLSDMRITEEIYNGLRGITAAKKASNTFTGNTIAQNINEQYKGTPEKLIELFRYESQNCPLLKAIMTPPYKISYFGWISLMNAAARIAGYEKGKEVMLAISLPGNISQNPTSEISDFYENIYKNIVNNNFMPYNCSKIEDCANCKKMLTGTCKSILPFLTRQAKRAQIY